MNNTKVSLVASGLLFNTQYISGYSSSANSTLWVPCNGFSRSTLTLDYLGNGSSD